MDKIDVQLIHCDNYKFLTQLACLITRGANKFKNVDELLSAIRNSPWDDDKIKDTLKLPHSKISRFTDFIFVITGASRRFLAQLTTHHVGISIMSGSLQYSDYSKNTLENAFVVPYDLLKMKNENLVNKYNALQLNKLNEYCNLIELGLSNDDAGYVMPQALRNVLLVKINLEELINICKTRLCKRNTIETRYVIAKMLESVLNVCDLDFELFKPNCCNEGKYSCKQPLRVKSINEYLATEFGGINDNIS